MKGRVLLSRGAGRDPESYKEAVTPAQPYQDSLDDMIREAVHPAALPEPVVKKLAEYFQTQIDRDDRPTNPDVNPAAVLNQLLEQFAPQRRAFANWWAAQFALETPRTDGISPADICRILGINREYMRYHIAKWRKMLRLPERNDNLRRQSISLSWKRRQRCDRNWSRKKAA